ncbi:MAG: uroporphyrinogen-III decarboxylase [Rhodopirellula sp.]|nr:uroporphyrinogen-III decarboxylase [Rhodopirellula sp.]
MKPRDRVLKALRHEQPDRVPLFYRDVPEVDQRLRRDLSIDSRDELLGLLKIDFRWVEPRYVGPPLEDAATGRRRSIWGVEYRYLEAGHGGYWETVASPLAGVQEVTVLDDYPWPRLDWFDFSVVAEQVRRYDDFAIMTAPGVASPDVIATIQDLLGMEQTFLAMKLCPEFFSALVERILQFDLALVEQIHQAAGGRIDFFRTGSDFGTQRGLLLGIDEWKRFFRPALAAMGSVARCFGAHHYHHTCGGVRPLIPHLIDCGIEVLDPLQVTAAGMAPAGLKADFGDQVCFSGGVDEQQLLRVGSTKDVCRGVRGLLDVMAPGGGFFVGPTHNFQTDIPTANILAMYEAARQWRYP